MNKSLNYYKITTNYYLGSSETEKKCSEAMCV